MSSCNEINWFEENKRMRIVLEALWDDPGLIYYDDETNTITMEFKKNVDHWHRRFAYIIPFDVVPNTDGCTYRLINFRRNG